jgi:glutamyl-tRNA synthetase
VLPHVAGGAELAAKLTPDMRAKLLAAMPGLKERAKTLVELMDGARFLFAERPIAIDDKAAALLTPEARALIGQVADELGRIDAWSAQTTEHAVRAFAERSGAKLGAVAQPLRAALTGRTTSPGIFDVLAVLGKSESLARLHDQAR